MRTCGELRHEIRAIHPSVLEDSSEDEDGEGGGEGEDGEDDEEEEDES